MVANDWLKCGCHDIVESKGDTLVRSVVRVSHIKICRAELTWRGCGVSSWIEPEKCVFGELIFYTWVERFLPFRLFG